MKKDEILKYKNVPVAIAAKYLDVSPQYIRVGLQRNRLPFGTAVQISGTQWTYQISPGALVNWQEGKSLGDWINENKSFLQALIKE